MLAVYNNLDSSKPTAEQILSKSLHHGLEYIIKVGLP